MPDILRSKALPLKHMTQVATAMRTNNFSALPICIRNTLHRTGNLVIKRRPTAFRFKFIG